MYKVHRKNTNFQIAYFLAGASHTSDGAFAMLCNLKEEREASINNYAVQELKNKAKTIRANRLLQGTSDEVLDGQAELLELENNKSTVLFDAAKDELEFINKCIGIVNPLRQYKHLPDAEAHEAAQRVEWKFELMKRAENAILTTGNIPTDHYDTMRMHPDFITEILPQMEKVMKLAQSKTPAIEIVKLLEPKFNIPRLLNL